MSSARPAVDPRGLFLQPGPDQAQAELQLFLWRPAAGEHHFYARGLRLSEFCGVFGRALEPLQVLLASYDPALLAPEFWEPYSRDVEEQLRQAFGGSVTRADDGARRIWRADRARAAGRLLARDPGMAVSLVRGRMLAAPGAFVAGLGDRPGLLEWAAYDPPGDASDAFGARVQADLDAFRAGATRPRFLFATDPAGGTRVVFSDAAHFRAAVGAAVRGYLVSLCDDHVAAMSHDAVERLAAVADGVGLASAPLGDFVDKGRTFEITGHLGRTRWGVRKPEALESFGDEPRVLVYYDRVSGIWEVMS
jgi:hypothetical protein